MIIISKKITTVLQYIEEYPSKIRVKDNSADVVITLKELQISDFVDSITNIKRKRKDANSFAFRDSQLSYSSGIQDLSESGRWRKKGRQVMSTSKFAKIISPLFSLRNVVGDEEKLLPRMVEVIGEKLKMDLSTSVRISDNVLEIYSLPTAENKTGTLGKSCMRPEQINSYSGIKFLNVYDQLTKDVKIIYLTDSKGKLIARALLWYNVKAINGKMFNFMDRVYGSEKSLEILKKWATENEFYYKVEQTFKNYQLTNGKKFVSFYSKEIDVNPLQMKGMPYFDTLDTWIGNKLSSPLPKQGRLTLQLKDTYGNFNVYQCAKCGLITYQKHFNSVRERRGTHVCTNCYDWSDYEKKWTTNPVRLRINGCTHVVSSRKALESDKNLKYGKFKDEFIHVDFAVFSEFSDSYILSTEAKENVFEQKTPVHYTLCNYSIPLGVYILIKDSIIIEKKYMDTLYLPSNFRENKKIMEYLSEHRYTDGEVNSAKNLK